MAKPNFNNPEINFGKCLGNSLKNHLAATVKKLGAVGLNGLIRARVKDSLAGLGQGMVG